MYPSILLDIASAWQDDQRQIIARQRLVPRASASLRYRLGWSLIRLGRRLAPDIASSPAWSR